MEGWSKDRCGFCSRKLKGIWDAAVNVTGHQMFTSVLWRARERAHQLISCPRRLLYRIPVPNRSIKVLSFCYGFFFGHCPFCTDKFLILSNMNSHQLLVYATLYE